MRGSRLVPILAAALLGAAVVLVLAGDGDEGEVAGFSLADAPEAVQAAVRSLVPSGKVQEVERETDDGVTVWEVECETEQGVLTVVVAETGEVVAEERELDPAQLPAGVRQALAQRYSGTEILEAEAITLHYFEVVVKDGEGEHEVKILASGALADDDEDEALEDEGEDDGEDD